MPSSALCSVAPKTPESTCLSFIRLILTLPERLERRSPQMTIEQSIKVGDFLTAASVFIGVIGLVISSFRDRRLRRKDYADRIRVAAATTAVAIDRWAELASRLYDDIQALIIDTDVLLVQKEDIIETRDLLWRGLVEARAISSRRILDEKLD